MRAQLRLGTLPHCTDWGIVLQYQGGTIHKLVMGWAVSVPKALKMIYRFF